MNLCLAITTPVSCLNDCPVLLTLALSASCPNAALRLCPDPPPGSDALEGRVRPTAYGALRHNFVFHSRRLGLVSYRLRSCS